MNKKFKYSNLGMNQDISNSKFSNQYAFENKNIRIIATDSQSTASIINDKGNEYILSLPSINIDYVNKIISYGNKTLNYITNDINYTDQPSTQLIIGNAIGKDCVILFTTDNNFDCVWKLNIEDYNLTLLYIRKLSFSTSNPIQALINYENNNIEKVYWVDGLNQMRFLNIRQSIDNGDNDEIIDIESSLINVVGNFNFQQPQIISKEQGGTHTAGMIQYAYTLYRLNGASTKLSPLSELVSLDNGENGGGNVNDIVSYYPVVKIPLIDQDYTNLRLYSIKYTSYNELPQISLILDKNIQGSNELTYYDIGDIINTVSLEEFAFLGNNNIYIPKHINTKFNRLFSANYEEKVFDIKIDTRAYSFKELTTVTYIYDSLSYDSLTDTIIGNNGLSVTNTNYDTIPEKFNCLNKNFDEYTYKYNSNKIGGSGKYLSWELHRSQIGVNEEDITKTQSKGKFFKDREIYRLGIQFYNRKAQISLPKWISDFKVNILHNECNLNGFYATIKLNFNSDFFLWLNTSSNFLDDNGKYDEDLKPVGFKLLRAERTNADKSIICQGILNGMYAIKNTSNEYPKQLIDDSDKNLVVHSSPKLPSLMRPFDASIGPLRGMNSYQNVDRGKDDRHPDIIPAIILGTEHPSINGGRRKNGGSEIYNSVASSDKRSVVYQFNQLINIYSPEITFNQIQKLENTNLKAIGLLSNEYNAFWGKLINSNTLNVSNELKVYGHITPYSLSLGGSVDNANDPDSSTGIPLVSAAVYQAYVDGLVADHNTTYGVYASDVPLYIPTIEEYSASLLVDTQTFNDGFDAILGDPYTFGSWGLIAPQGRGDEYRAASYQPQYQFYRKYEEFVLNNELNYNIYGNPLIVETGSNRTVYNKDNDFIFYNTYQIMNTDSGEESDNSPNWRVKEMNSWGARCAIFALGNENDLTKDRTELKNIFQDLSEITSYDPWDDIIADDGGKVGVLSELTLNKSSIYLGLLYGGNDYESRKKTNYIEIGTYTLLIPEITNELTYHCKNGGDTFIDSFKFTKIVKTNIETYDLQIPQFTEIVDIKIETSIDLKNRTDYSVEDWDSRFQPKYEEYQNYNRVYSQEPNFFVRKDVDYNFKSVFKFENGIIPSSVKIPGEIIDSWLRYLTNDVMYLDGKHGSINCLHSFKDEIYTLQDRAIASISINPRVQVQGNDGISIQLGTGQVLDRYQYITTMSGTLNKWSVTNSPNGFYYYDNLNKSIYFNSNKLSDIKGMHTYLINNVEDIVKINNPILRTGVISTYDYLNNEIIFTFLQENSFTFIYNELTQSFTSFYDYIPSMYISINDKLLAIHPDNNKIYQQGIGEYNKYFDIYYPSYIIYNLNPESDNRECIFDNINFKSECYLNNIDQDLITINNIQCYNDYQDSTLIPLINGRNNNLRRKFREWNAIIPREGRNRIRGPYSKLKLQFNNTNNYKLILHDVILDYTS